MPDAPTAPATAPPKVSAAEFLRALALAAAIAIPISLAALGFMALVDVLNELVWTDAPQWLGMGSEPPWWWLLLVPVVLGIGVALARRLPGHAEHGPLDGFATHTDPRALPGILLAALLTLVSGVVLGPEAPLLALGTGLGLLFAMRATQPVQQMSSAAGGFAAFSALLGNPLVTAMFLLESSASTVTSAALLPGLLASGIGYLVFTGLGGITGITLPTFSVPGLTPYPTVELGDLAQALLVSVAAALLALVALAVGKVVREKVRPVPLIVRIPVAGLLVGLLGVLWVEVSGQSYAVMMFSGEQAIPQLIAEGAAGTVLLLLVIKTVAYAISLGSGFRGGPIFPVLFLGVGMGVLAHLVLPIALTPAVACAMAAATSAAIRLPFAASALSLIMVGTAGAATTVLTILGAVVGFVVAKAVMAAVERRQGGAGSAPAAAGTPSAGAPSAGA